MRVGDACFIDLNEVSVTLTMRYITYARLSL